MYSCVFWCEFIDLVAFFGSCCLTPVTLFIIRSKGSTEKQPAVRTLSTRRRFATRKLNPSNHRFFRPEVNFYFYFIPKCCLLQSVFSLAGRLCSGGFYDVILPQIAQARNMSIVATSALLRNIRNIRTCMAKKPIVSVTYENERISIKNSLPQLKCVLRLSCVAHGPIYGRFMGFLVKGFELGLPVILPACFQTTRS